MSKPTSPTLLGAAMIAALLCAPDAVPAQILTGAPLPPVAAPPRGGDFARVFDGAELDRILSPIALYPDPLLAQVLSAATFASEIPVAQRWVDARRNRSAEQLVEMLEAEEVSWDPSVQALVAFPTVLRMMATSMPWTTEVGDAFRLQRTDVMDGVQRLREQAQRYGYLRSTPQLQVVRSPSIEILPVDPAYVVVPYYNPVVVFAPPRPRFLVSSAINLGYGVRLGLWYEPWGWRTSGIYWSTRHIAGGYPGWNRYRPSYRDAGYRDAGYRYGSSRYTYDSPRYGSRTAQPRDFGYERASVTPREVQRREEESRSRRLGYPGAYDNRPGRESPSTPRASQPRVVQRVTERPQGREPQRASPQSSQPRGGSEQRVARRRN